MDKALLREALGVVRHPFDYGALGVKGDLEREAEAVLEYSQAHCTHRWAMWLTDPTLSVRELAIQLSTPPFCGQCGKEKP